MGNRGVCFLACFAGLFALTFVACVGTQPQPTATAARAAATAGQATSRPMPTPTPPPASPTAPTSIAQLRVALDDMGTYDLVLGRGTSRVYMDAMYDYIIGATIEGVLDSKSGFATAWESNPQGTAWTFRFRDNVVFHDGTPASAKDVVFGINRARAESSTLSDAGPLRQSVSSIEMPDERTMTVSLTSIDIFWAQHFLSRIGGGGVPNHVYPKSYFEAVGDAGANKAPVGSGPYKFVNVTLGESLTLEAVNQHWFFGTPRTKRLVFREVKEETVRVTLLKGGQVDLARISRRSVKEIRKTDLHIFERKDSAASPYRIEEQYVESYPGYGKNPLADPRVRRALDWYAIDRQAIVDTFLEGMATPTMNNPVVRTDPAYEPLPIPAFDPARAKALLAEAGYPNGFELDLYIWERPGLPEALEIMEAVAIYWEAVGIKVNRQPMDYASWRSKLSGGKGWSKPSVSGLYYLGHPGVVAGTVTVKHLPRDKGGGIFNTNFDPELNRLTSEWKAAKSLDDYVRIGKAYQQRVYDLVTDPVLFTAGDLFAGNARIVPKTWELGRARYSYQIEFAAARG